MMTAPFVFSPYDYAFHDDPYPFYARLRNEFPVYHNADLGFWALSRHEDVYDAFRDYDRFSNANGVSLDPGAYGPHAHKTMSFLAMDDPRHMRLRSLVSRGFTPRRIKDLGPRIREITREHLLPAVEKGEFDYIQEFAGKLPMDVISELMGVPREDRDRVRLLADAVVHRDEGVNDVPEDSITAALDLIVYYSEMLKDRRRSPSDDLTSALLEAEIDGDRLTDDEIIGFLFLMVIAGNETTTKLLANAAYWGHRNPEEIAKPLNDPAKMISPWIEETLRYDTSSQLVARTAVADITLHDVTIPEGDIVLLLIGSANRDERVFANGDEYSIGRDSSQTLQSFGGGVHFCLGSHLARLEANIALAEFVDLVGSYRVDEERAVRVHSSNVRGFSSLPMTVQPR